MTAVDTYMDSCEPRDNARKIGALLREETRRTQADLYRTCEAGPSGQRRSLLVGTVRFLPDGPYEFRIVDRLGESAGYATRRPGSPLEWTIWRTEYDGAIRLHSYASALSIGVDALLNGDHAAAGRHDSRRTSGGRWIRFVPQAVNAGSSTEEQVREAFRNRRAAMTFRCQNEREPDGNQCTGAVRIRPEDTHGKCAACGARHGRDLEVT